MKRFMGMMPIKEIEIENTFKTSSGPIIIQAGENGWTILYADGSSEYMDEVSTAIENYQTALNIIANKFCELRKVISNDVDIK